MLLHKPFLVKKISKYFRIQFKHLFLFLYKALSLCLCQGKLSLNMATIIQLFKELHYYLETINKANTSKTILVSITLTFHGQYLNWLLIVPYFLLKNALLFMQQLNKSSKNHMPAKVYTHTKSDNSNTYIFQDQNNTVIFYVLHLIQSIWVRTQTLLDLLMIYGKNLWRRLTQRKNTYIRL